MDILLLGFYHPIFLTNTHTIFQFCTQNVLKKQKETPKTLYFQGFRGVAIVTGQAQISFSGHTHASFCISKMCIKSEFYIRKNGVVTRFSVQKKTSRNFFLKVNFLIWICLIFDNQLCPKTAILFPLAGLNPFLNFFV